MKTDFLQALRPSQIKDALLQRLITPEIEAILERSPKMTGSFGYDPWGYNGDVARIGLGVAKLLYERYFRVTTHGLEHIPKSGRVLIVPNHSGQVPMDGVLLGYALTTNVHAPRTPRAMIERFFPTVPYLGNLLTNLGAVIGDPINCVKMLQADEAIIVFPEGVRGSGKLYKQRYQLQRFGNGFMHLAIQQKTPIVPVGIVGCEETMPAIANIKPLAKLLGLPMAPVAPPLPLPARVYINIGEPMHFDGNVDNETQVTERVEQVKSKIRELIERGQQQRTRIF